MSIAVHMQNSLVATVVDEDWEGALQSLNAAGAQGKSFVVMDGMNGDRVMFNIPNILILEEIAD